MQRLVRTRMKTTREVHEKSLRTAPGQRLRDRLERSAAEAVLGREREMDRILRHFDADGAVVTFVHGIGGVGKSSLLAALAPRLADRGARVARLDGRTIEPTPRGLLAALGAALDARAPFDDVEAMARELDSEPRATAIVIDEYDRIRLLDAWLRHELLPAQPDRTRWLFARSIFAACRVVDDPRLVRRRAFTAARFTRRRVLSCATRTPRDRGRVDGAHDWARTRQPARAGARGPVYDRARAKWPRRERGARRAGTALRRGPPAAGA